MAVKPISALAAGLICVFAAPSVASAADRFAEPGGDGPEPCAQTDPCDIVTAVNSSMSGDDITLLSGSYSTSTTLGGPGAAFNRTIHGAPGARPTINFTAASTGQTGVLLFDNSVIRDVVIESTAGAGASALFVRAGKVERVSVHETGAHVSGPNTHACVFDPDTVVRDTVCWYSGVGGSGAAAVQAQSLFAGGTSTMRNVTAVATNAPAIVLVAAGGTSTLDLTATNVIARGGGAALQEDVRSSVGSVTDHARASFDHSNYETESEAAPGDITDPGAGSNVTTDPAFVNAATGDFHELGTSAGTLNLGTATGMNQLERDIDGQSRLIGSAPDIGADEFLEAPSAPSITGADPPSGSNENSPLLIGTAEPFSTVHVFASNDCTGPEAAVELAEVFSSPGIGVSVPDDLTTTFSANTVNSADTSACSVGFAYTEDSTAPVTTIDSAPSGSTADNTPTVNFHVSDANGATTSCKVDSGISSPCSSPATFGPLADGSHTITIQSTDPAGNVEGSPPSVSFTVSAVQPGAPVPAPPVTKKKKCKKKKKHRAASVAKKKKCKKKKKH